MRITMFSTPILFLILAGCGEPEPDVAGFEATLNKHVSAIQNRNLDDIEATITTGTNLDLIFPGGKHTETRAEYLDFHKNWFAEPEWSMKMEKVRQSVGQDMAYALFKSSYTDSEKGKSITRTNWLSFTFKKEGAKWALIADQNTPLPDPK